MRSWKLALLGLWMVTLAVVTPGAASAQETRAAGADARTLAGYVVDPQDRRLVSARVSLTCAGRTQESITDGSGAFTFDAPAAARRCALTVTARGFAPASETVDTRALPWVVHLRLAPITEKIDVHAPRGDDSFERAAAGGVVLSREQLRTLSNDPNELVRYATALAGGGAGGHAIYVDGLPANELPPVSQIASMSVATDPYSAEYSDPAHQRIEIVTTAPDRRWRFSLGGAPPTMGARNPLTPESRSRSRSLGAGISGPAPWTGGSFSFGAHLDHLTFEPPIVAVVPGAPGDRDPAAHADTTIRSVSFGVHHQWSPRASVRIEGLRRDERSAKADTGGEVLAEAASFRKNAATEVRATLTRQWATGTFQSDVLVDEQRETTAADRADIGVWVPGMFIAGGAPLQSSASRRAGLVWKNVLTSQAMGRQWRAGFVLARSSAQDSRTPNPAGHLLFTSEQAWLAAQAGLPTGTQYRFLAPTNQRVVLDDAAAFAEVPLMQGERLQLRGGMRVDLQSRDRVALSPRLFGAADMKGWIVSGGAGSFTEDWRPQTLLGTAAAEGRAPVQTIARQVSLADAARVDLPGDQVNAAVTAGLTRTRYFMTSEAVGRTSGALSARVEHVWRTSRHLLGARRLPDQAGWTDWLESNRSGDWHELRARFEASRPSRSVAVNYTWIHATDDTDGPFSFPARQDDLRAERARSTGVPSHNIDLVASAAMPGGIRASAVASLRSGAPYNIVSGVDAEANGRQTDRGGRPRNSGTGPRYQSFSLYLYRRFSLSRLFGLSAHTALDAGLQIDNLFGTRNWTAFGQVAGSPLFGRPEAALPGRSLRVWFAIAR